MCGHDRLCSVYRLLAALLRVMMIQGHTGLRGDQAASLLFTSAGAVDNFMGCTARWIL
jgi:hypothetical protein